MALAVGAALAETKPPEALYGLSMGQSAASVRWPHADTVDYFVDRYGCVDRIAAIHDHRVILDPVIRPLSPDVHPMMRSVIYAIRANLEKAAAITGAYHTIDLAGRSRHACLSFHQDRLYLIAFRGDEIDDILPRLLARFDRNYRPLRINCQSPKCPRAWMADQSDVLIEFIGYADQPASGDEAAWALRQSWLIYTAASIKSEQVTELARIYGGLIDDNPVRAAQRERDWLNQVRGAVDRNRDDPLFRTR